MSIKEKIHALVERSKDRDLLQWIYKTLDEKNSSKDFMSDLSDEQIKSYEESSAQADRGETISHNEAMKRIDRWKKLQKSNGLKKH
jgi:predicted transcriptional regulator